MAQVKDLTATNKDYSVFLPSISTFYSRAISKYRSDGNEFVADDRVPDGFEFGVDGCDFLKKDDAYYSYKWGLYSAGHAQLNLNKADVDDHMVQKRDRKNTFILGDSGGFQIIKGVIKCDWDNFKTDDSLRQTILNWLEYTADYSMILDIPTMAASEPYKAKTGIQDFGQCLDYTLHNCDWFVRNRQGKTKYMNVLQGRTPEEAQTWFDAVKHLPFEGWAFGGATKYNMLITLRHIIQMRDQKLIEKGERDLLHFLGTSKLDWAVALTAIKRNLRETVNEDVEVMFDCASPFIATAKGQLYTQHVHRHDRFGYVMDNAIDNKKFAGSDIPFPWNSPVAERMTMGDICHYAPGRLNKIGTEGKTSWDSFSYFLLMAHNVYQHIESVQRANSLTDSAITLNRGTDVSQWSHFKANKKANLSLSPWVPAKIIYMVNFIDELFKSETPMSLLDSESVQSLLSDFNGTKSVKSSSFAGLFDVVQNDNDCDYNEEDAEEAEEFFEHME